MDQSNQKPPFRQEPWVSSTFGRNPPSISQWAYFQKPHVGAEFLDAGNVPYTRDYICPLRNERQHCQSSKQSEAWGNDDDDKQWLAWHGCSTTIAIHPSSATASCGLMQSPSQHIHDPPALNPKGRPRSQRMGGGNERPPSRPGWRG